MTRETHFFEIIQYTAALFPWIFPKGNEGGGGGENFRRKDFSF